MNNITITEALAEIKTINKRLEKKRQSVTQYLARDSRVKDPLEKDGGSADWIGRERQAIGDLEARIIAIRTAIQSVNLTTMTTVNGTNRSIAEWLTWRREVSTGQQQFLTLLINGIRNVRAQVQKEGGRVLALASAEINTDPKAPPDVVVNVDEKLLLESQENLEQTLGELDGKLSLLNATITINV